MHYKKDGSLDMRYSSSRAAVSSGYGMFNASSASSGGRGYGYSSYSSLSASSSSGGGNLHYKANGALDMRYSSSRAAAAGSGCGSSRPASASSGATCSTPLNRSIDAGYSSNASGADSSGGLRNKKDGSLDMRYKSSREATGAALIDRSGGGGGLLKFKKDGSLDMRYKSSKEASSVSAGNATAPPEAAQQRRGVPAGVPLKKDGTPDMRCRAAQQFLREQARLHGNGEGPLPDWVPQRPDGSVDTATVVGRQFEKSLCGFDDNARRQYWHRRAADKDFWKMLLAQLAKKMALPPPPEPLSRCGVGDSGSHSDSGDDSFYVLSDTIPQIEFADLKRAERPPLGRGAFGEVWQADWRGQPVAVKQLLAELTKRDKPTFKKELEVLMRLTEHPNLVRTLAYCLSPACIVMELLPLGSLHYVLHVCEDAKVEAQMADGRVKRRLALGVACGVQQLHELGIVHNDLKPQNVLVADDMTAKVGDFGLAQVRAKTLASTRTDSQQQQQQNAGTPAYMAPELLKVSTVGSCATDAYAFGILLNELVSEMEPYYTDLAKFAGKGPMAVVRWAAVGNRPAVAKETRPAVAKLVRSCWAPDPKTRPVFAGIVKAIRCADFEIDDSVGQ